jgi:L-iditol 2-dehydrogenase
MLASVWYNNKDIRLEEVPTPKPGPREMLVKVIACGICGSDVVEWYRLPRAPLVQGHEIGAQVVEVGEAVKGYKVGDRVCIAPKVPCMECSYCRDGHYPVCSEIKVRLPGGYAQYILVPETLVEKGTYPLPDGINYEQSTFIEPLACVVRAQNIGGLTSGQTVLILGCGMSGLLHVKLAKTKNCRIAVTDVNQSRLELAGKLGADLAIDATEDVPQRVLEKFGKKADVVMVCASALPAIQQAWKSVDKGGAVVFFAVPGPEKDVVVPLNDFWTKEIRILTAYYCGPNDIRESMRLIETGTIKVEDLITHRLPLEDTAKGFELVAGGRDSLKVIIRPADGLKA